MANYILTASVRLKKNIGWENEMGVQESVEDEVKL